MNSSSIPAPQASSDPAIVEAATPPLALRVIPALHRQPGRDHDPVQLATTMRSLVVDANHPIALEIAGTSQQRSLIIRARNHKDLTHVETQLRARLPHVRLLPLGRQDDPFRLDTDETVSTVELRSGQPSYLPLQDFARMDNGDDPLLGVLAAVDALPADLRAIAQIALVPAAPDWSRPYQRKAVEHPLEPERHTQRHNDTDANEGAPPVGLLLLGALILGCILFFQHFPQRVPSWLPETILALGHGHWSLLWQGAHHLEVDGMIAGGMVLLAIMLILRSVWARLMRKPLYDMRTVAEKTSRPAYHVRLRLYVIGPAPAVAPHHPPSFWPLVMSAAWAGIHESRLLIGAHAWNEAAQTIGMLLQMIGKSLWYLMKQGEVRVRLLWDWWSRRRRAQARRQQVLARLIAAYRQYHLASGNYFIAQPIRASRARRWVRQSGWAKRLQQSGQLVDVEALAALWHIPTNDVLPELAHMAYHHSRHRLLPPSLEHAQQEFPIGVSEHAGHQVPFGLPAESLRNHFLIGGKSGEGKSTFLQHLALRTMREGGGLILIDPHGDLAEQVIALVPPERSDAVVFLDLSDERFACGLNPIDATVARGRDKAISDLIKVLSRLWTTWGSRMEIAFEYALRTLYEANKQLCQQGKQGQQYTLLDVMTLLTDESFCHALLDEITDPFILRWWASYYDPLSLQMQRDRVDPVLSKTAKFESTIARHIVGQSLCSINFPEYIQQEKIVLIKLAKGLIGEDVARILGATLLGFLHIALEEQGSMDRAQRKHVPILIDEFQTFDGVDWGALAELRKYGATFCLATQSLDYLREKQILSVVLANVKQFAIFRMSADDAQRLYRELDVEPEDIVHLETLTCYLKVITERHYHPTFSCRLRFPAPGAPEQVEQIRTRSQQRDMRPVSRIDTELFERLARTLGATPSGDARKKQADTPAEPGTSSARARQEGGNRGRKAQQKRDAMAHPGEASTITPMNWEETVGPVVSEPEEQEHNDENDPNEH